MGESQTARRVQKFKPIKIVLLHNNTCHTCQFFAVNDIIITNTFFAVSGIAMKLSAGRTGEYHKILRNAVE